MKHSEEQPLRVRRRCMRGWERWMELGGLREMGGVGDRGRKGCAGACTEEGEARTAGSDGERDRVAGDGALWSRGRVGGAGPGIGGEEEAEGATGEGCDRKGKRERS